MLQRDRQIRTQIQQVADACLIAVSFWLAFSLRGTHFFHDWIGLENIHQDAFKKVAWLIFVVAASAPLILQSQGFYNRQVVSSRRAMFWPLTRSCIIVTSGLVLLFFLFRADAPRGVAVLFAVIAFTLVWLKEEVLLIVLRSRMAKAQYRRRIILAGIPSETARLQRGFHVRYGDEVEIAAEFNLASLPISDLIELLHEHSVSGVLVSAKHAHFEHVENIIKVCEIEGVEAYLVADFFATQIARASFDELLGHPLIVFRTTPEASWEMMLKLAVDFFGALVLLILLTVIPVIPAVALAIKLTSPGPVLFRQQRSGLNGAPFTIFKFRTMNSNAEQLKHELAAMNEMSGPVFKVTNDPRVTSLGRFLRKWSLDELPQLFNVLRGEMSLVGPRPLPVDEVKRFNDLAHRRRLSVKPGLTCLWQVSGRNQISDFKEWVRLDLEYIDNWSFWLDVRILFRTIPAVLRSTGAK